jgi:hypothetical protein
VYVYCHQTIACLDHDGLAVCGQIPRVEGAENLGQLLSQCHSFPENPENLSRISKIRPKFSGFSGHTFLFSPLS